eukprot:COSAG06_NODE_57039_length_282_cov_0.557377_2_plen_59_part_01
MGEPAGDLRAKARSRGKAFAKIQRPCHFAPDGLPLDCGKSGFDVEGQKALPKVKHSRSE